MKRTLRQGINNYLMPTYMRDILINNYCPSFLSMTIVKEDDAYKFSYDTGHNKRLEMNALTTVQKLQLLRSVMKLNYTSEDWLIKAEEYLLEPELLYSYNNGVKSDDLRILFYPDFKNQEFNVKFALLIDKIKDRKNRRECEIFDKLKELSLEGDMMILERTIVKYTNRLRAEKTTRTG